MILGIFLEFGAREILAKTHIEVGKDILHPNFEKIVATKKW